MKMQYTCRSHPRGRTMLAAAVLAALQAVGAVAGHAATKAEISDLVAGEAERNQIVPASLALAVARVESNFNPDAHSDAGARGVMQIMPETARDVFGVDPDRLWQPRTNVRLGIRYLEKLYRRYDRKWKLALSHYNGGSLRGNGGDAIPHDYTRDYVNAVMHFNNRFARQTAQVKLASAAGSTGSPDDAVAGDGAAAKLTEHPSEYMVFDDAGGGDGWRQYLEAADYWLASPKEKKRMREKRRKAANGGDRGARRFAGSGDAGDLQESPRRITDRNRVDARDDQGDRDTGDRHGTRDGHGHGDYDAVTGESTGNRFTRASPEVKELRDNFQRYLGDG